jgi:UDP-glucose 4-epimerase
LNILVTGASGFVGRALVRRLLADGHSVRAASRTPLASPQAGVDWVRSPDLAPEADWRGLLDDVEVVVHLAARVHVMRRQNRDDTEAFQRTNAAGTQRLAEQAAENRVRRLIFVSSVKVHGEAGAFVEDSPRAPSGPYAVSKRDAEDAIMAVSAMTALETVVVRPPLVYGPGAKANFAALSTAVRFGFPLPLGGIRNYRSLVGVDNLVDVLSLCAEKREAAGQAFLVSDGDDVSTPELVRRMAKAIGRRARLFSVPDWCLGATLGTGRPQRASRLTGSLRVDITKARRLLGWTPPYSVDDQLRKALAVR